MAWIKRTGVIDPTTGIGMILLKHWSTLTRAWDLHVRADTGQFAFSVFDSNDGAHTLLSPADVIAELDAWVHVTGTYDRANGVQSLYINGSLEAQAIVGLLEIQETDVPTRVGCYNLNTNGDASRSFFNGITDEVMIFNRALGPDTVSAYYQAKL